MDGVDYPLSQNCGSHIDNVTLEAVGYLNADGEHASVKGYICPFGQICMVSSSLLNCFGLDVDVFCLCLQENNDNPEANIESFDVICYAALQVVIVSSMNGVSGIGSVMLRSWKLKFIAVVAIDVLDDGR